MIGTVGDTKIGTPRRTPDAGRTQFVPRQRVPSLLVDRPGRPAATGAGAGMVALLADPLKDSRERLAAALTAAGATGVLRGHPGRIDPGLPDRLGRLTPRELEVLKLVADGRSNKWIAEELSLSALTVKSHLSRISRKLGTGERSHQVAVAMRAGVLR